MMKTKNAEKQAATDLHEKRIAKEAKRAAKKAEAAAAKEAAAAAQMSDELWNQMHSNYFIFKLK